jgi:hypothetical protein
MDFPQELGKTYNDDRLHRLSRVFVSAQPSQESAYAFAGMEHRSSIAR